MMNTANPQPSDLIREAREGDRDVLSQLINRYRPYLQLLARLLHDDRIKSKVDDSDLVQEVSALAIRDFGAFQGVSEAEFTSWLRTMMARVAAKSIRHFTAQRRDIALEQQLQEKIDHSSCMLADQIADRNSTPSEQAIQLERAVMVSNALQDLPDHYREVVILRDFKGLEPKEIAIRMETTSDAVCKIWARAMVKIRRSLEGKI